MYPVDVLDGSLWSMQYDYETTDIVDKLFNQWNDPEYMESFFNSHRHLFDNYTFWKKKRFTFGEVHKSAEEEAAQLTNYLISLSDNSNSGIEPNLETKFVCFHDLSKQDPIQAGEITKQQRKMYGKEKPVPEDSAPPSVLRLYALKFESSTGDPPLFVVTGGGIKLSDNTKHTPELEAEKERMQRIQRFFLGKGIKTREDFLKEYQDNEEE